MAELNKSRTTKAVFRGKAGRLIWCALFLAILGYFVATNGYHTYSEIRFKGISYHSTRALFSWDSGSGFNYLENETVELVERASQKKHLKSVPPRPGAFDVYKRLPFYDIKQVRLTGVEGCQFAVTEIEIRSKYGNLSIPVPEMDNPSRLTLPDLDRNTKRYFHPVRFVQQVLFALFITFLAYSATRAVIAVGGWKQVFLGNRRGYFWGMFVVSAGVFSIWLLTFWPGQITADSIDVWRAARIPGAFINYHPVLNVIYYRFLQHIWNHFAVVCMAQILLTSLLGAYIFYDLMRKGINKYFLLPFYVLFITSVSIATYNITLWKDVPFALCVVFWAYTMADFMDAKKRGRDTKITKKRWLFLGAMFVGAAFFRHNGIVYLLFIPLGLVTCGVFRLKATHIISTVCVGAAVAGIMWGSTALNKTDFLRDQFTLYFEKLRSLPAKRTLKRIFFKYDDVLDIKKNRKKSDFWKWHRKSNLWHFDYIKRIRYNDYINYIEFKPVLRITYEPFKKIVAGSLKKPWLWLSWNPEPVLYLFLIALLMYKWFPRTAMYAYLPFVQALILIILIRLLNWRYYYFLYLSTVFAVPVFIWDIYANSSGWRRLLERLPFRRPFGERSRATGIDD